MSTRPCEGTSPCNLFSCCKSQRLKRLQGDVPSHGLVLIIKRTIVRNNQIESVGSSLQEQHDCCLVLCGGSRRLNRLHRPWAHQQWAAQCMEFGRHHNGALCSFKAIPICSRLICILHDVGGSQSS